MSCMCYPNTRSTFGEAYPQPLMFLRKRIVVDPVRSILASKSSGQLQCKWVGCRACSTSGELHEAPDYCSLVPWNAIATLDGDREQRSVKLALPATRDGWFSGAISLAKTCKPLCLGGLCQKPTALPGYNPGFSRHDRAQTTIEQYNGTTPCCRSRKLVENKSAP